MMVLSRIPKKVVMTAYVLGTVLMIIGLASAAAQGDAPKGTPKIASVVVIFTLALAFLFPAVLRHWPAKQFLRMIVLAIVGLQMIICLFFIAAEFTL